MIERESYTIITSKDLKNQGGAEESIRNILGFNGRWCLVTPYDLPRERSETSIKTDVVKIPFTGQKIPPLQEIKRVIDFIEEQSPKKIILEHPDFYSTAIFIAFSEEMKRKTVAIWRGVVDRSPFLIEGGGIKRVMRPVYWEGIRRAEVWVGNRVSMNLAVSSAVAESLVRIGIDNNVRVIPEQTGGEYTPELRQQQGEYHRKKFLDNDEMGVLVVSRIAPDKGLFWVPQLYEFLRKERRYLGPDSFFRKVRITLVGGAEEKFQGYMKDLELRFKVIERETANIYSAGSVKFDFTGFKNREELQEYYNAYDLLFMPSPCEGFGRVTVEAMNAGMTVIGRSECQATRIILDKPAEKVGILVGTPDQAGDQILRMMGGLDLLAHLQSNALRWSSGHYSLKKAEEEFIRILG